MATRVLAPSFGEGVEELTVVNWLKKEGDPVKELEVIVELETDKVTTEMPSPATGVLLKILAKRDAVVKVGSTLAWIGQPGDALEAETPAAKIIASPDQPEPDEQPTPPQLSKLGEEENVPALEKSGYTGIVSPLVKNLVDANNIDLNLVPGTGLDGRITKEDVLKYIETRKEAPSSRAPRTTQAVASPEPFASGSSSSQMGTLIPHTSLRRQIAERMVDSVQTSPHVLTVMEADLSKVVAHRTAHKAAFAEQGIYLTLTAYFCAAIVSGLKAYPDVNAAWTEEGIQRYNEINLGVATSLGEQGLIVPIIKNAAALSLQGLAQNINDLSTRARTKKLLPEEARGGTFTLTNHGSSGSLFASPIIFQPQAAILGTGVMHKRPIVITDDTGNDAIAIRPMIYLSLVFDHRMLDGEGADLFLMKVKQILENWH